MTDNEHNSDLGRTNSLQISQETIKRQMTIRKKLVEDFMPNQCISFVRLNMTTLDFVVQDRT